MSSVDSMGTSHLPKIFILGSCVSRDIFELEQPGLSLAGYLARTSMAGFGLSAVSDEQARNCAQGLQSPFQRNMILNDLDKTTLSRLKSVDYDFILLDFIDERFNLVSAEGSLFSLSGELEGSGFVVGDRCVITPQSKAFEQLWLAGFERFINSVDSRRVILNKIFWAATSDSAEIVYSKSWVERNNAILSRLYEMVECNWNVLSVEYAPNVIVGDSKHRWGVAPYHYTSNTYRYAEKNIISCIESVDFRSGASLDK